MSLNAGGPSPSTVLAPGPPRLSSPYRNPGLTAGVQLVEKLRRNASWEPLLRYAFVILHEREREREREREKTNRLCPYTMTRGPHSSLRATGWKRENGTIERCDGKGDSQLTAPCPRQASWFSAAAATRQEARRCGPDASAARPTPCSFTLTPGIRTGQRPRLFPQLAVPTKQPNRPRHRPPSSIHRGR